MEEAIIVAILSLIGTLGGSFGGIITANKLTNYRIQELEKKVDAHNNFANRIPVIEERVDSLDHQVEKLEKEVYK